MKSTISSPAIKTFKNSNSQLPKDLFLWSSVSLLAVSATLKCLGKTNRASSVGQWIAPLLLLGIYYKFKHENQDPQITTQWSE